MLHAPAPAHGVRQSPGHGAAQYNLRPATAPQFLFARQGKTEIDNALVKKGISRLDPDRSSYPIITVDRSVQTWMVDRLGMFQAVIV